MDINLSIDNAYIDTIGDIINLANAKAIIQGFKGKRGVNIEAK